MRHLNFKLKVHYCSVGSSYIRRPPGSDIMNVAKAVCVSSITYAIVNGWILPHKKRLKPLFLCAVRLCTL